MSVHSTGARSAELSWASLAYVKADEQIRCRRDYIVVEPLDVDHGTTIIVKERTKPLRGIVKAVGPGHYPKRYDHPDKHRRSKTWDSKTFQPTQVKCGDVVELGGYEYGGYNFQSFLWGDKVHLMCREADVSGIVEDQPPEVFLVLEAADKIVSIDRNYVAGVSFDLPPDSPMRDWKLN